MTVHVARVFDPTRRMWYFLVIMFSPFIVYRLLNPIHSFDIPYVNDILISVMLAGFVNMMICSFGLRDFLHLGKVKYEKSEFTNITEEEYLKEKGLQNKSSVGINEK